MPSTYISLTNRLLRKFNEVEVSEGDFLSARGVQGRAKDAVLDAVQRINQQAWNWPFNAMSATIVLEPGQSEYVPSEISTIQRFDWESFAIQGENVSTTNLRFMDRENWYERYRNLDTNSGINGRSLPRYVFPSHGLGFGITPVPNEPYTISFRYWLKANGLQFPQDLTNIPQEFDYVIISCAAIAMHEFRDNAEAAALMRSQFRDDFSVMRNLLLNNYDALRDTRIPRRG